MFTKDLTKKQITAAAVSLLMLFSCIAVFIPSQAAPPPLINGQLDLSNWSPVENPAINLAGSWLFFPNTLLTPEQLTEHNGDIRQRAVTIDVPSPWNPHINTLPWPSSGHGTGTYWLRIKGSPNTPISLSLNRVCSSANIYFFSHDAKTANTLSKLGKVGTTPALSSPYGGSTVVTLPFTTAGTHHLLIQTANFDFSHGGICGAVSLGSMEFIEHRTTRNISILSMLIAMIGMAAVYLLAIYSQNHRSKKAFWLMCLCFASSAFFMSTSGLLEQLILSQQTWLYELRIKITFAGLTWAVASLLMFYANYFSPYVSRDSLRLNLWLSALVSALILALPAHHITAMAVCFILYWGIELTTATYILARSVWDKIPYAIPALIAALPMFLSIPYNSYKHTALNEIPLTSLYSFIFFIFVHSMIISRHFFAATSLAEKLSENLQNEVAIRTAELHQKNKKLEKTQLDLKEANEALKKLSITDGLTRIYNRMYFEQEFRKEWHRCMRLRQPISVLMIDVDHFKRLNDSAGHLAGDQALRSIARALHNHFKRAGELVARYGGEEFVVMLPDTDQRSALAIAEGFRHHIEKLVIYYNEKNYLATISIGISTTTPSMKSPPEDLLAAADSALYKAKNTGRNKVEIIPLLPSSNVMPQRSQPG